MKAAADPERGRRPRTAALAGARALLVMGMAVACGCVVLLASLRFDTQVLAAFPGDAPEVSAFATFAGRFGALSTVQLVIETDDALAPSFLRQVQAVSKELATVSGVANVLSLTTVMDITADPVHGGVVNDHLVDAIPANASALAELQKRVMSRSAVVGNLIAADRHAIQIIIGLDSRADPSATAARIAAVGRSHFPTALLGEGGAPAVQAALSSAGRALAPRLILVIAAGMLSIWWLFRDGRRTALGMIACTCAALVAAMGYLAHNPQEPLPPALAPLPLGWALLLTALAIHISAQLGTGRPLTSWRTVWRNLMPTYVAIIGMVAVMAAPMLWGSAAEAHEARVAATGVAIGATVLTWLLPAWLSVWPPRGAPVWPARSPRWAAALATLVIVIGASSMPRLSAHGTGAAILGTDSLPGRASALLRRHFSTGDIVQLEVDGDMSDPIVLRRVQQMVDTLTLMDGVVHVSWLGDALRQANGAMEGSPRLPDTRAKAQLLSSFLASDAASHSLVTADGQHAALYVMLAPQSHVVPAVEKLASAVAGSYRLVDRADMVSAPHRTQAMYQRLLAAARTAGVELSGAQAMSLIKAARATPPVEADKQDVARAVQRYLASDESGPAVPATDPSAVALAHALAQLGPHGSDEARAAAVSSLLPPPRAEAVLAALAGDTLVQLWQNCQWDRHTRVVLEAAHIRAEPEVWRSWVTEALLDDERPQVLMPAAAGGAPVTLQVAVHGEPVLDRILGTTLLRHLWHSFAAGAAVLWLVMIGVSRSLVRGSVLTITPVAALVGLYGGMAALQVPLDIPSVALASSMLALAQIHTVHACSHVARDGRAMVVHGLIWGVMLTTLAVLAVPPVQSLAIWTAVAVALGTILPWILVSTLPMLQPVHEPVPQTIGDSP